MRKAVIDHAWEECRQEQRAQLSVCEFEVGSDDQLLSLPITSRITGFIGPNGAGKTGFLTSLRALFAGNTFARSTLRKINGQFRGRDFSIRPGIDSLPAGMNVEFIDVSLEVHFLNRDFEGQVNFEELLSQFEPHLPNTAQLGLYRHVCGRPYNNLSVVELDASTPPTVGDAAEEGAEERVYPFFQVVVNDVSYDSRTMGFGELCGCYLLWRLNRANKGTIILLDEPDSHLSPLSRRALIDAMAILAKERQLWIGFTTHSIELLESLKDNEIYLVSSDTVGIPPEITPVRQRRQAVRNLGLALSRRLLIVVEDVDALAAAWCIINRWGSEIARLVDVQVVLGGATEVVHFINNFPETRICSVIAILDGDKRSQIGDIPRIYFLPGVGDPIDLARAHVTRNCDHFASVLGADANELRRALGRTSHVNHHDFLAQLLDEQNIEGKGVQDIRIALLNSWLSDPGTADAAKGLVHGIVEIVDATD
ncbi:MAG: AAA family ATPase [Massilia sp.]